MILYLNFLMFSVLAPMMIQMQDMVDRVITSNAYTLPFITNALKVP